MPSQEDIDNLHELLIAHRQTLSIYLKRQALLGIPHTPPEVVIGINSARAEIRKIKKALRAWGITVEDLPSDQEPIREEIEPRDKLARHKTAKLQFEYRDRVFNSRVEARWAAFFDIMEWKYEYKPYDLNGWTPSFVIYGRYEDKPVDILIAVQPFSDLDEFDRVSLVKSIQNTPKEHCEIVLLGSTIHESKMWGILRESACQIGWIDDKNYGWDECVLDYSGFFAGTGYYGNRVTGAYDGDHHLSIVPYSEGLHWWNLAANDIRETKSLSRSMSVFLCHGSEDKEEVRNLYRKLKADGVEPWLDEEKLLPGQDWELEIRKTVRKSDIVLVCLSRKSATKSGFVQKEIRLALDAADEKPDGMIFLIPVRLEECDVPERLKNRQWVNLYEERGYERLMQSLQTKADDLGVLLSSG